MAGPDSGFFKSRAAVASGLRRNHVRVRETAAELTDLQTRIDRSHARARPHLRGIIHQGQYSLGAGQVVKLIDGMKTIAVATPAPNGDPLVGPMDGWFLLSTP